jgi:hypothetical protein
VLKLLYAILSKPLAFYDYRYQACRARPPVDFAQLSLTLEEHLPAGRKAMCSTVDDRPNLTHFWINFCIFPMINRCKTIIKWVFPTFMQAEKVQFNAVT